MSEGGDVVTKGALGMKRTAAGAAAVALLITGVTANIAAGSTGGGSRSARAEEQIQKLLDASESQPETVPAGRGRPARADGLTRALANGKLDKAEYALERARSLFDLRKVRNQYGDVRRPASQDATLLLRDLAAQKENLTGFDGREAERILARPDDGDADPEGSGWEETATVATPFCRPSYTSPNRDICVHYVTDTDDAPSLVDNYDEFGTPGPNGAPDAVDDAYLAIWYAWANQVGTSGSNVANLGYPAPRKDGDNAFDVYLANIGADGLYGYCAADEPGRKNFKTSYGYCVFDDDYEQSEYEPGVFGFNALLVTAAHEFFHAIQFNMDWREQAVLMEGTATWIEDVEGPLNFLDPINANYAYLQDSALHSPEVSFDDYQLLGDGENFEYGAWLFYRFLEERYASSWGRDLIHAIWDEAAGSKSGVGAIKSALSHKNISFSKAFAEFARWNRTPATDNSGVGNYEEGNAYLVDIDYRYPAWDATFNASPWNPSSGKRSLPLDHLSSRYALWFPYFDSNYVDPNGYHYSNLKLKMTVDLPAKSRGPQAYLMVTSTTWNFTGADNNDRCTKTYPINLNDLGNGSKTVPFAKISCGGQTRNVFWTTLVLTNTGSHDNERYGFSSKVVK